MKPEHSGFETADKAEEAFYHAFVHCDHQAMKAVWMDDEVVCIHPSSHAIVGYDAVMRSWSNIFSGAALPNIQFNVIKKTVSDTLVVHVVEEHISAEVGVPSAVVLATNIFRKTDEGWLMIEHHAAMMHSPAGGKTIQ